MIVHFRVLELCEIQRGGVAHEAHALLVREQIAEQALNEGRQPGQSFSDHRDGELDAHESRQVSPVWYAAAPYRRGARDDRIDDELADPQHRGAVVRTRRGACRSTAPRRVRTTARRAAAGWKRCSRGESEIRDAAGAERSAARRAVLARSAGRRGWRPARHAPRDTDAVSP